MKYAVSHDGVLNIHFDIFAVSDFKTKVFRLTVAVFDVFHIKSGIISSLDVGEIQIKSDHRRLRRVGRCWLCNGSKLIVGDGDIVLLFYPPRHICHQLSSVILLTKRSIKIHRDAEQILGSGLFVGVQIKLKRRHCGKQTVIQKRTIIVFHKLDLDLHYLGKLLKFLVLAYCHIIFQNKSRIICSNYAVEHNFTIATVHTFHIE